MSKEQKNGKLKSLCENLGRHVSLTMKMFVLTLVVGIFVWFMLDRIQTRQLRTIFQAQLTEKLGKESLEDRLSFDRHVKMFQESIKLLATQKSFIDYIETKGWMEEEAASIQYHLKPPVWFPNRQVLRTFIQPRFVLLLDSGGKTREVYHGRNEAPSGSLLEPSHLLLLKSHDQSFMTTLDNVPYMITAESHFSALGELRATLVFASPIDEELLRVALGPVHQGHLVALLTAEEKPVVFVSSDRTKLPEGIPLKTLQDRYLVTGNEFFDYGASELPIKLVSFASLADVELMTNTVVSKVRHERATLAFILIVTFAMIICRITRHIHNVNRRIRDFSHYILGTKAEDSQKGDQLQILKKRFTRLTEEVIEARETIKEQAEEKSRLIAHYSSDAIITIDSSGVIKQWNPRAESLFGWSSEETVGLMSADTIMPQKYHDAYKKTFVQGVISEQQAILNKQIETTAFHRDGHAFPVEFSISPKFSDGGGLIAIVHDLTKLRKSEAELRKFKFVGDNSNDAHFLVNRDAKFEYVNKTACRMLGYSEDELLTLRVPDVDIIYDIEKYQELFDVTQKDSMHPVESINKRKDGTLFPSEITVTGHQIDGENFMVAALKDITGRKKIEESISFLAQVLDTSPISVIAADKNGNITYVNPATEKLFGYKREELFGVNPIIFNAEPKAEAIQSEIMDTIMRGEVWAGELLNKDKHGNTFIVSVTVYQLLDHKGDFIAFVGFQEDITRRKRTERLLEVFSVTTLEGKVELDSLFDSVGVAISMQGTDFMVLYQNRYHRDIAGDQVGQYCYKAYQGRDSVCERCHLAMAFEDGQSHQLEQSRTTDSGTGYYEITGTPVKDSKGTIIAGIEVVKDITERRKSEEKILNLSKFPSENPSPVLRVAHDFTILYANKASQALLRRWGSEVGKPMPEEWHELIMGSIRSANIESIEIRSGQCWFLFTVSPVTSEGYVNLHGTDITDLKRAEEALQKAKGELETKVEKRTIKLQETVALLQKEIMEREKAEKKMRISLEEKDVLLREVHHRVKNNLQIVCSLYNLQSRYIKDRESLVMLKECQNRIRAISLVHENLYHSEVMSSINLKEYVARLVNSIIGFYEINLDQVKIKLDIEDISFDLNTAIPCGLMVNEIVANSLLYAFPDGRNGEVSIVIRSCGENEIEFILSDNGIGIPDELMQSKKQSLGLHLVDILVTQLQGKVDIDNSNGTRFHIVFKEGK